MKQRVILVVDDNLVSRMLPAFILRTFPMKVLECETGDEAMCILAQENVSHVLLDISLSDDCGLDVARKIRQVSHGEVPKLVAYTADARSSQAALLKTNGFESVLLKPIKRSDLLVALGLASPSAHPQEAS